jgi:bifunctional non-homologous end joining protein LigD
VNAILRSQFPLDLLASRPLTSDMLFIEPCLPTISRTVPTGREWVFEIKHDGFRFLAARQRKQVRVYSRGGHDWSERLPAITEAMQSLPVRSVVLDGEDVICGADGKSDFDRMRAPASAARAHLKPSYTPSTCWSLTARICAQGHGRPAVQRW